MSFQLCKQTTTQTKKRSKHSKKVEEKCSGHPIAIFLGFLCAQYLPCAYPPKASICISGEKLLSGLLWSLTGQRYLEYTSHQWRPLTTDGRKCGVITASPLLWLDHLTPMDEARTTLCMTLLLSHFYHRRVKRRLTFEHRRKANNNKQSLHSLSASNGSDFNLNYLNFHSNTEWEVLLLQVYIRLWAFSFSSLYFHVCFNVPAWYVLTLQACRTWAPIFWHIGIKRCRDSALLETLEHYCSCVCVC